ncbi:hypothetical protein DPEC_G00346800 [Dallia pectoralis]|uniref:Uncharacterized protein n=1 Tax=Dallia pectoralis TaxID=75939 RepID=A0ACC2F3W6_DALPE|nr:hypothetical protein DPEC_G00346800 [Dallia pectoralis]
MGTGSVRPTGQQPARDCGYPCASWQALPPICGGWLLQMASNQSPGWPVASHSWAEAASAAAWRPRKPRSLPAGTRGPGEPPGTCLTERRAGQCGTEPQRNPGGTAETVRD